MKSVRSQLELAACRGPSFPSRLLQIVAVFLAVAAAGGCKSDDGRAEMHPVEGQLLIGGKPASGAQLTFYPQGVTITPQTVIPSAIVKPDGSFQVTTYANGDGVAEGEYVVTVVWPRPGVPKERDDNYTGDIAPDMLKGRFSDPSNSPLRATITKGTNRLATFRLD